MSEPFIGEIRMVGFNFAPRGWAFCDGQLLQISQNMALFSLIGTIYGGDGRTTFALPDLRGRVPIHAGSGAGLTPRQIGQPGGAETVVLNVTEMPSHNHGAATLVRGSTSQGTASSPQNAVWAVDGSVGATPYIQSTPNVNMQSNSVEVSVTHTGGSESHNIMQPFLVINFIIALVGLFPSRS